MPSLSEILRDAAARLAAADVDNPALDARLLIAHALNCDRAQLLTQDERLLTAEESATIQKLIERRANREPVARILGLREFWGLPFGLNEATLDPRPDSETLVEAALKNHPPLAGGSKLPLQFRGGVTRDVEKEETPSPAKTTDLPSGKSKFLLPLPQGERALSSFRLLDLGTGTGCLLLALLHEWPHATGLGVDIAPRAVEQAQANAKRLGLEDRAAFRANDWLDGTIETFDVIICNPPYIASAEIPALMPEVRDHDPRAALDGGEEGLAIYRLLIPQLPRFLNPQGFAVFEIGQGQAEAVCALFRQAGFRDVSTRRDLGGIERCVAAKR